MNAQTSAVDFGFNSEEFKGEREIIPYAQFLNPVRSSDWGIGIKMNLAEAAGFAPDDSWKIVSYQFNDGKEETLILCQTPRLVVLNRSGALMSKDGEVIKYDASKKGLGTVLLIFNKEVLNLQLS